MNLEPRISPDGQQIVFVSTGGSGALQPENCRPLRRGPRERARPRRAAREPHHRYYHRSKTTPSILPGLPTGSASLRDQRGDPVGYGLDLLDRRRGANRSVWTGIASRRRGPARPEVAPDGKRILFSELPRRPVAPALAHHHGRRAPLPLHTANSTGAMPLVARRQAHCVHQQQLGNTALFVLEVLGRRDLDAAREGPQDPPPARLPSSSSSRRTRAAIQFPHVSRCWQRQALARCLAGLDACRRVV